MKLSLLPIVAAIVFTPTIALASNATNPSGDTCKNISGGGTLINGTEYRASGYGSCYSQGFRK